MLKKFLESAKSGNPVYISHVCKAFNELEDSKKQVMHCVLTLLENDEKRLFDIHVPRFLGLDAEEINFIKGYVWAELYNILSSLGGKVMHIYVDSTNSDLLALVSELNQVFQIDTKSSKRDGYGKCINVNDRMMRSLCPNEPSFKFMSGKLSDMPKLGTVIESDNKKNSVFKDVTNALDDKIICGMDIGGTDIKLVLAKNGAIDCYKEYDWFPALFNTSIQLVEPICLLVRLMRVKISMDRKHETVKENTSLLSSLMSDIHLALEKNATDDFMLEVVTKSEHYLAGDYVEMDAIGLCFPDVVVKDKIVGGECYKARGIRNNPNINFEEDLLTLTNLDLKLQELIKKNGRVNIINDGPMASFTAAVEMAVSPTPEVINKGIFAHTLGTELGTGWVMSDGSIPDIPLEVYNYIIDLGSFQEKQYPNDDIRSINNFNTNLPGTLQKYCSQSGIFRLAMKYFPTQRPDLYKELFTKNLVVEKVIDGQLGYYVPMEPNDQRKAFLEHMMTLPERENDEVNAKIWRNIGEFLAITWIETQKILKPATPSRILFGRLVKNSHCFDLIKEGAKNITHDIVLEVADATMANTPLMKQLESNPQYTVAQFAQAIGAVYFGNQ